MMSRAAVVISQQEAEGGCVFVRRVLDLDALVLASGAHGPGGEMCLLEAVAYVAGEAWSDEPMCACPVLSAFLRAWNDDLGREARQDLRRFVMPLVASRSSDEVVDRRMWLCVDWLARVQAPAWLDLAGLGAAASALRALGELCDAGSTTAAASALSAAGVASRDVMPKSYAAAFRSCLSSDEALAQAAFNGVVAASRKILRMSIVGGGDAVWGTARAAAQAAAACAVPDAVSATAETLRLSALDLVDRMLALEQEEV